MNFLSDDTAPVAPAILNAIAQANAGRTSRRRLDPIRRAAIIRNFERKRRCSWCQPGQRRMRRLRTLWQNESISS
jgi:hypothetical protein